MLLSQLLHFCSQVSHHIDRQIAQVAAGLHKRAQTSSWARVALDLFFKSRPERYEALNTAAPPHCPRPAAPKRRQSTCAERCSAVDGVHPGLTFKSSLSAATPPQLTEQTQRYAQALMGPTQALPADAPSLQVQMLTAKYRAAADAWAAKLAAPRGYHVFAESREVKGMAHALDAVIDVYSPVGSTLVRVAAFNPSGKRRIAVMLQGLHYSPLRTVADADTVGFDAAQLGLQKVADDGSCFFHSVARFEGALSDSRVLAHRLRQMACDKAEALDLAFWDEPVKAIAQSEAGLV